MWHNVGCENHDKEQFNDMGTDVGLVDLVVGLMRTMHQGLIVARVLIG